MTLLSRDYQFAIDADRSAAFAHLSGDFNPLHVDQIKARRTQFGKTVVHGIHTLLKSIDAVAGDLPFDHFEIAALTCTFSNPLPTGHSLTVRAVFDPDTQKIRLSGEADQLATFSATLTLEPGATPRSSNFPDAEHSPSSPREVSFPPQTTEGDIPLWVHKATCDALFPVLGKRIGYAPIADLLASTRVIGMECPGLDSIYSVCKFQRRAAATTPPSAAHYKVTKLDERFRLARIAFVGSALEGTLEAFFRPQPVRQKSLREIVASSDSKLYAGHRALVVGGSRGLGELTAKILLAGGADVTITYSSGLDDARRIAEEARTLKRPCEVQNLDVRAAALDTPEWLKSSAYSHVYYFASPHIGRNPTGRWNQALFDVYSAVYLQAFAALIETLTLGRPKPVDFFYPSSIFVEQPEKGFAEYAIAKAAGEELCRYLSALHGGRFAAPRLPRMRTDQTSGLADATMPEAFDVMHAALQAFLN